MYVCIHNWRLTQNIFKMCIFGKHAFDRNFLTSPTADTNLLMSLISATFLLMTSAEKKIQSDEPETRFELFLCFLR